MAQSGKGSIKRGKPSYFMSILGVTLVLFLLGIIGWSVINANKIADYLKENVEISAELRGNLVAADSTALMQYIGSKPYVKSIEFVTREEAKRRFISDGNEGWDNVLDDNPLYNSIDFTVKKEYMNTDSLAKIKTDLAQQTYVAGVSYPSALVDKMDKNIKKISIIILVIAVILSIVVIFLIDNTIRLAMFSNRFLIKTMQMVGATRGFIARPMNIRAIINGAISGIIATTLVFVLIMFTENVLPWMKAVHDNTMLVLLFTGMIILGIFITVFSTHRSVIKYLKMKLDDLY